MKLLNVFHVPPFASPNCIKCIPSKTGPIRLDCPILPPDLTLDTMVSRLKVLAFSLVIRKSCLLGETVDAYSVIPF
jgi:hypothetical protein